MTFASVSAFIMPAVGVFLLVALSLWFIMRPLFRAAGETVREGEDAPNRAGLLLRRDALYSQLRDVEFDYETGKLSGEDHALAREKLMLEAADVLRALDAVGGGECEDEDAVEREVRRAGAGEIGAKSLRERARREVDALLESGGGEEGGAK